MISGGVRFHVLRLLLFLLVIYLEANDAEEEAGVLRLSS